MTWLRENVPDPRQIADWVIHDIEDAPGRGEGELDILNTTADMSADDLRAVVIELAHRIVGR